METTRERLIRRPEVERRVGLKRSALYDWMAKGKFPKPVHIGGAVAWRESDVDKWIQAQVEASELTQ